MSKGSTAQAANYGSLAHLLLQAIADPNAKPISWANEAVEIEREGKKIILPNEPGPMPIDAAIESLERLKADEEEMTDISEVIVAYPLEAAVAFVAAMEQLYGWASPVPTPSFFGPIPPKFLSVQTDVDTWIQVPWGSFKIPGIENNVQIGGTRDASGRLVLRVTGEVRKKERKILLELAAVTREILKERSIYRGKALHITTDTENRLDLDQPPTFMDVRGVNPAELILNRDVDAQVETNIYAPIKHTAKVRAAGIPLKRGVLLEGRYGVGKTMTTRITAKHCVDNGWTFIVVDRPQSLKEALLFAQRYQPAVVFCEDIDRAMSERDEGANDLLNTIDGVLSKSAEVMVVLTTNHVELIEPAMLRPGRLDAVITVLPPDGEAVERLIKLYARGLLAEGETLVQVGHELAGNIPASIREVVERSKLAMISNGHDKLHEEDLLVSARGMASHLALLAQRPAEPSVNEKVGAAFRDLFKDTLGILEQDDDAATSDDITALRRNVSGGIGAVLEMQETIAKQAKRGADILEVTDKKVTDIHKAVI